MTDGPATATRLTELAAQLKVTQEANTKLIARVVDLEVERDVLRDAILYAQTMGMPGHIGSYLRSALVVAEDRRADKPPPLHCWNCGLPLNNDHIRDEAIIRHGVTGRQVSTHRACADHLLTQGWTLVAQARGTGQ